MSESIEWYRVALSTATVEYERTSMDCLTLTEARATRDGLNREGFAEYKVYKITAEEVE